MPMFERNDHQEVVIHATRPVFKRGVRLKFPTIRRIRDILINQLDALGMDPEDIACVFGFRHRGPGLKPRTLSVSPRQIRNRISESPSSIRSSISRICHQIMRDCEEHTPRPVRPPSVARHPSRLSRIHRSVHSPFQKTFLFDENLEELDVR